MLSLKRLQALSNLAKDFLPPLLLRQIRRLVLINGGRISFEGPFLTWEKALHVSTGYDTHQILEKVLAATLKVKNGQAIYERDSVIFDEIQYSWPVTAGLMRTAARFGGRLSVLDFGGSLGSSYFQNRKFLNGLQHIHWSVVEQPHFVEAGRNFIQDDQLLFYESVEHAVEAEKPNVILLSSVLQYLNDPYQVLDKLTSCGADTILIDRTPFHDNDCDTIMVQKIEAQIYPASYPLWIFSRQGVINYLSEFFELELDYLSPEGFIYYPKGVFSFNGIVFQRR